MVLRGRDNWNIKIRDWDLICGTWELFKTRDLYEQCYSSDQNILHKTHVFWDGAQVGGLNYWGPDLEGIFLPCFLLSLLSSFYRAEQLSSTHASTVLLPLEVTDFRLDPLETMSKTNCSSFKLWVSGIVSQQRNSD